MELYDPSLSKTLREGASMLVYKFSPFIFLLFSLTTFAKTFTYQDKAFARNIMMTFKMQEHQAGGYELDLDLKIKILGVKIGGMSEKTLSTDEFIPRLDSRCRTPRRNGRKFNCFSSRYFTEGEFLVLEFNGKRPTLESALSADRDNTKKLTVKKQFPEFDLNRDKVYNLSTVYFLTLRSDFGLRYHDRVLYVTGSKEIFKIKLSILDKKNDKLHVTLNVLKKYRQNEKGKYISWKGESDASFPGEFFYDKSKKMVTSLNLKTSKKTYELKLKQK